MQNCGKIKNVNKLLTKRNVYPRYGIADKTKERGGRSQEKAFWRSRMHDSDALFRFGKFRFSIQNFRKGVLWWETSKNCAGMFSAEHLQFTGTFGNTKLDLPSTCPTCENPHWTFYKKQTGMRMSQDGHIKFKMEKHVSAWFCEWKTGARS